MIDKDLLTGIDIFRADAARVIGEMTTWIIRQFDMLIRRKCSELLVKKLGAIYTGDPTIIFVRMIRRVDHYTQGSKLDYIFSTRSKFNDTLNDAALKIDQRMMTINLCNTSGHFDRWGNLSQCEKTDLWYEIDDLVEHFDEGRIKLLPAPKHPGKCASTATLNNKEWHDQDSDDNQGARKKMPTPRPQGHKY